MTLLAEHFERIRSRLDAECKTARSFSHGLNRGQIREAFIREFLVHNISDAWGIGTGEIINRNSTTRDKRNQIDVVVYNKRFPKLSLAAGIDLFFIETVSSFIEIKSFLTKSGLRKAIATSKRIKSQADSPRQQRSPLGHFYIPRPYSFVFSYDGPKRIETVRKWLNEIAMEEGHGLQNLQNVEPGRRRLANHQFIDGVFLLGRGFVHIDAGPFSSLIGEAIEAGRNIIPESMWIMSKERELLALWTFLNKINEQMQWIETDLLRYVGEFTFHFEEESDS